MPSLALLDFTPSSGCHNAAGSEQSEICLSRGTGSKILQMAPYCVILQFIMNSSIALQRLSLWVPPAKAPWSQMKNLKRLLLAKLSVKTFELSDRFATWVPFKMGIAGIPRTLQKKKKKKTLQHQFRDIEKTLEFNMATALEGPGIDEKIIGDISCKVSLWCPQIENCK